MGFGTRLRFTCIVGSAALAVAFGSARVFADDYCDIDPGVAIHTPAGNNVVVHVNTGGPTSHLSQLASASRTYTVDATDGGASTAVTLTVAVADNDSSGYAVNSSVWTGANRSGSMFSSTDGIAGQPMAHHFVLRVP